MLIRVNHLISILFAGVAVTAKWISTMPAHVRVRFAVRKTAVHNRLAEAS